ncbi:uncharacterized protein GIQ15_05610 [Arthroderma uncinatum]|uniref:uncharacterized protein n=1 Tax=Arthroderma uncinatum TaxID=74035 RepID=UPI00144A86EA|nr:uncharacterized protein GIQ15_05610 [Arthroderma uncinatum]KAF3480263.1 hypothetical protein GIQ15_05610 [Arthroderma uncinatum]
MNQGLELTHFPEPQLQDSWDFLGELEDIRTLAELGLLDEDCLSPQDGINSLAGLPGSDGGVTGNSYQVEHPPNDNGPPWPHILETEEVFEPKESVPTTTVAEASGAGKQILKRPFDSIGCATDAAFGETTRPAKWPCHLVIDDTEPRASNSHPFDKYPSPTYDAIPASLQSYQGTLTGTEGPPGTSATHTDTTRTANIERTSIDQHMLSLPPSTQQLSTPTVLDSSARAQREPSVDSLFDSFDDINVPDTASAHQPLSLPGTRRHTLSPSILSPPESPIPLEEPPVREAPVTERQLPASASELLRTNNNVKNQDLINYAHREIFTMPCNAQKYISPYPRMGGPLGYFPSTPTVHVKSVEVAEDTIVDRMNQYRKLLSNLRYDRNKYLWLSKEWTAVDSRTGKTKAQEIKEECSALKRLVALKEKRATDAMTEAEFWRNKYQSLAVTYGNLASQHKVAMAPQNAPGTPLTSQSLPAALPTSQPSTRTPSISGTTCSEPVSIDLTAEEPVPIEPRASRQTPRLEPNVTALNGLRKKKYQWLDNNRNRALSQRATQIGEGEIEQDEREEEEEEEDDDDELAQMMMRELESTV